MGRLSAYGSHLLESRDRHEELQRSLHDAQSALENLLNDTKSCETAQRTHAQEMEQAAQGRSSSSR